MKKTKINNLSILKWVIFGVISFVIITYVVSAGLINVLMNFNGHNLITYKTSNNRNINITTKSYDLNATNISKNTSNTSKASNISISIIVNETGLPTVYPWRYQNLSGDSMSWCLHYNNNISCANVNAIMQLSLSDLKYLINQSISIYPSNNNGINYYCYIMYKVKNIIKYNNYHYTVNYSIENSNCSFIKLNEIGLPNGTNWDVNFQRAIRENSTTTNYYDIEFNLKNYSNLIPLPTPWNYTYYPFNPVISYFNNTKVITVNYASLNNSLNNFYISNVQEYNFDNPYTLNFKFVINDNVSTKIYLNGFPNSSGLKELYINGTSYSTNNNYITLSTKKGEEKISISGASLSLNGQYCYKAIESSLKFNAGGAYNLSFEPTNCLEMTFNFNGLPKSGSYLASKFTFYFEGSKIEVNTSEIRFVYYVPYNYSFKVYPFYYDGCTYEPNISTGVVDYGGTENINFTNSCLNNTTNTTKNVTTTFIESGLPTGYSWDVVYNNVNKSSKSNVIKFYTTNGSFSYHIDPVFNMSSISNCTRGYEPSPTSGTIKAGKELNISFYANKTECITTFIGYNVPQGYNWSVEYNGSVIATAYDYPVKIAMPSGNFTIRALVGGLNCNSTISGRAGSVYNISLWKCITTIEETGLPARINWNVTYDSITKSTNKSIINFSTNLGFYSYLLPSIQNLSYNPIIGSMMLGAGPTALLYNPSNRDIYVTYYDGNVVAVISKSNSISKLITVGNSPDALLYDPSNKEVYVANYGSNTVSEINSSSNSVIATINVGIGSAPDALAYYPIGNDVYVADAGYDEVSIINSSNVVIKNISVGKFPDSITYNTANNGMYLTDWNAYNDVVTIINTSNYDTKELTVKLYPQDGSNGILYNPFNKETYVISPKTGQIIIINLSNSVVSNINVCSGVDSLMYNPNNKNVYVTCQNGSYSYIQVISSATNTVIGKVAVGDDPDAISYDPLNNYTYVAYLDYYDTYCGNYFYCGGLNILKPKLGIFAPNISSGSIQAGSKIDILFSSN